jgi:hypothetical protein
MSGSNAQFTSAGKGLTVVNDYCYAYSGSIDSDTAETTLLEFATGKRLILAKLTGTGATAPSDATAGLISLYRIYFNNIEVMRIKADSGTEDMPTTEIVPLLIPPLTMVKVSVINNSQSSSYQNQSSIVGKLYG